MNSPATNSEFARERASSVLAPGEKLLWCGQADAKYSQGRLFRLGSIIVGSSCAMVGGVIAMLISGTLSLGHDKATNSLVAIILAAVFFFDLIIALVVLMNIKQTEAKTVYALTNERALVISSDRKTTEVTLAEIRQVDRRASGGFCDLSMRSGDKVLRFQGLANILELDALLNKIRGL